MHILSVLFFPGSAEADIGWGGKLNGHLMSSCVINNVYIVPKLLKLDNPSWNYGKNWCVFMPHSVGSYYTSNTTRLARLSRVRHIRIHDAHVEMLAWLLYH